MSVPSTTNPALNRVLTKPGTQDLAEVVDYFLTQSSSPFSTQLGSILETFRNNDASILSSIYDLVDQVNALSNAEFGGTGPAGPPGPPGLMGPAGPGTTIPTQITIVGVQVSDSGSNDATGQPMKTVTVSWSYPAGWNGQGVYIFNDYPDSAGALFIADGSNLMNGGNAQKSTFNPKSVSPFTPYDPRTTTGVQQFSFTLQAPTANTFGRVYVTAGTATAMVLPVQSGQPFESPSIQYTLTPRAGTNRGGEQYAPQVQNFQLAAALPSGWAANPNVQVTDSGDQWWQVALEWGWPAGSPAYSRLGGVQLVLDDTLLKTPMGGHIAVGKPASYVSDLIPMPRGGGVYTIWADSYDVNGQSNSITDGVTPSVSFTISRSEGPPGAEKTSMPVSDGIHPMLTEVDILGPDGSHKLRVTGFWKHILAGQPGYDPSFGGAELAVQYGGDPNYYAVVAGVIPPIQTDIQYPAAATTATLFLRGVDVNGNPNSIQPGITPSLGPFAIGGGKILNLTYADPTYVSSSFYVGALGAGSELFQINTKGIQRTHIADLAIDTPQLNAGAVVTSVLTTSEILIGSGGGRPIRFRMFDNFGGALAWIGDDSINSGKVGGWFKQLYIGGANPSSAPIVADSLGAVSINGAPLTLFSNGITTTINNVTGTGGWPVGLSVNSGVGDIVEIGAGSFNLESPGVSIGMSRGDPLNILVTTGTGAGYYNYGANGTFEAQSGFPIGTVWFQLDQKDKVLFLLNGGRIDFTQGLSGTAGSLAGYVQVKNGGVTYKLPLYN